MLANGLPSADTREFVGCLLTKATSQTRAVSFGKATHVVQTLIYGTRSRAYLWDACTEMACRPRKQQRGAPSPTPAPEATEAVAARVTSPPVVLTSAQAVASRLDAQLGSLPHVVRTISAFLDNAQKWTLESATDAGSVTLLERLRVREWVGACKDFREARFLRAVRHAAVKGHLDVLNWCPPRIFRLRGRTKHGSQLSGSLRFTVI